ncbi:MAG: ATP F0F1 synthase subunit B [Hyphomicrobiales bacterium]
MDATFWAFAAFLVFFAIVFYMKAPSKAGEALDKRAAAIKAELDEARRLRDEAQGILAEYQRKRQNAEREADDIVAQAKAEAERLTEETSSSLKEMIERRTRAAEIKIAQAEAQAIADVRAAAADVAVAAAEKILTGKVSGDVANGLIAASIAEVKSKLN